MSQEEKVFAALAALEGLRVLVVDDDADTCELVRVILEQHQAEVTVAKSASEALAAMKRLRPDVLVSDIAMPGEDGYALIQQLRAWECESGAAIPALALTAYAGVEDRIKSLSLGFQMYLSKPVAPAELTATIANLAEWNRKG